ncbi:MAG: IS1595 family transposase [Acidobacteriia bacterium]|nr:IS1595 family transposase [Terriglobia bacterium]
MEHEPKTLQEAIVYFSNPANCREYLVARRWPNGVTCPRCGSDNVLFLEKYNRWHCREKHDAPQFTLKTGTIFEDSPLGLDKWLTAMWQIVNCKNGISSYEVHRAIGITQKSAWFMDHRIRLALGMGHSSKLSGHVEADETFIGGKARNMHKSKRDRMITGRGTKGKTVVMGFLQRPGDGKHSQVKATVIEDRYRHTMQTAVKDHVAEGSNLITDEFAAYTGLEDMFSHEVINHAMEYVKGHIHTNGMDNFWSLLKRGLGGTYVSVEPFHLFRYLDEQEFRFNNRGMRKRPVTDGQRFDLAVRQIVGKRLTYKELTGKTLEAGSQPF